MILIGFSGPAGCGKDTAEDALSRHFVNYGTIADSLARHLNYGTMAFAYTLKSGICEMFYLNRNIFNSRESKEAPIPGINKSPRELAQIIGTDCIRKMIGENTWVHIMARRYADFCETGLQRLAITDVRFENEAEWIRSMGGTIIHIVRPGVSWNPDGHESEHGIEIKDDDMILTNNGSLAEFEQKTLELFATIEGYA